MANNTKEIIGLQGITGAQGFQGAQGSIGAQGQRGIQGAQGRIGMNGAQGIQGLRGEHGMGGFIGLQGAQGTQGIQGHRGPRGYMGYIGGPGEVGIQGLTGAKGHIWVDGISLDGYNTHLFQLDNGKLVSIDGSILTVNNGAKISIWLDQNVYDYLINNNGQVTVDNNIKYSIDGVDTLEVREVTSTVYYAGETLLTEIIDSDNDLNTIVELVYYNESWYYSGGLIGSTSNTPIYENGKDIKINEETNTIDIALDKDITSNIKVGCLNANETLTTGMSLSEILERILIQEVGGKSNNPVVKLVLNSGIENQREVGTALGTVTFDVNYTDGYYSSADTNIYTPAQFNQQNNTTNGKLLAGCVEGDYTLYYNINNIVGNIVGQNINSYTSEEIKIQPAEYKFHVNQTYSESEVKMIKSNLGNDKPVNIVAGNINSNEVTINFYYTTTVGVLNNIYWNESINSLVDNQGNIYNPPTELNNIMLLENDGDLLKSTTQNENNEYSIPSLSSQYIIVPQGVTFFIHASADPQKNNLISQYRKYPVINDKGISYDIYIYSNNGSAAMGVKGLKYNSINNVINAE